MRPRCVVWLLVGLVLHVDPGGAMGGHETDSKEVDSSSSSSSSTQCTRINDDDAPTDVVCRNPLSEQIPESKHNEEDEKIADGEDSDDDDDEEEEEEEDDEDGNIVEDDELLEYFMELSLWGKPQTVYTAHADSIQHILKETTQYMEAFLEDETNVGGRNNCRNRNIECSFWASEGECDDEDERDYMVELCSPACKSCDEYLKRFYQEEPEETDLDQPDIPDTNGAIQRTNWGVPQYLVETVPAETFQSLLDGTTNYMRKEVMGQTNTHEKVISECENKHPYCTYWAAQGECEVKTSYMHLYCAPTCGTCDVFDYNKRCPIPEGGDILSGSGDLNRIFERIVTDPVCADTYGPLEILSSPELTNGPWIITLDNFLNAEECTAFIEAAEIEGYERSEDEADDENLDGTLDSVVSDGRTSSTSWCYHDCVQNPILKPVHERLEKLTGIPFNNSEHLQLLKYEVGQFYEEHHDYSELHTDKPPGPRILTAFMYLNDVAGGGGTRFGPLNLTVQPIQGRLLLWPSVLDDDPYEWDPRTMHEALSVTDGMKHGSNAWFHLRDFKGPSENECI